MTRECDNILFIHPSLHSPPGGVLCGRGCGGGGGGPAGGGGGRAGFLQGPRKVPLEDRASLPHCYDKVGFAAVELVLQGAKVSLSLSLCLSLSFSHSLSPV